MSNLILKCFKFSSPASLIEAFKSFVRPILEYSSEIWSPYLVQDIATIESVQRWFSKRLQGLENLTYPQRIAALGLQSLEERRHSRDLKMGFRILNELTFLGPPPSLLIVGNPSNSRAHSLTLTWPTARTNVRHYFFQARVGRSWNSLPYDLVSARSLLSFNRGLSTLP